LIGTKLNDLDLCLEVVFSRIKVTSTTALHSTLNISETVRDTGLVPKDHHSTSIRKMAWAISWGHVTDDDT